MTKNFLILWIIALSLLQPSCGPQSRKSQPQVIKKPTAPPEENGFDDEKPVENSLDDFYNSPPGLEKPIAPLSSPELSTFKAQGTQVRIDAMLVPKDATGKNFATFNDFNAFLQKPENTRVASKIFRQMRRVIEGLGLDIEGYRWVFEHHSAPTAEPFYFSLLGGEPVAEAKYLHMLDPIKLEAHPSSYALLKEAKTSEIIKFFEWIHQTIAISVPIPGHYFRVINNTGPNGNQVSPFLTVDIARGDENALGPKANPKEPHRFFQSKYIREILAHIDTKTLVVLDIDETLALVPGHIVTKFSVSKVYLAEGENTLDMWRKLLELTTNQRITMGSKIITLTARSSSQDAWPALQELNLEYSDAWIRGKFIPTFDPVTQRGYSNKIVYAAHHSKGEVLKKFLTEAKAAGYGFEKIVFADDNATNISDMVAALKTYASLKSSISFHYVGRIIPNS